MKLTPQYHHHTPQPPGTQCWQYLSRYLSNFYQSFHKRLSSVHQCSSSITGHLYSHFSPVITMTYHDHENKQKYEHSNESNDDHYHVHNSDDDHDSEGDHDHHLPPPPQCCCVVPVVYSRMIVSVCRQYWCQKVINTSCLHSSKLYFYCIGWCSSIT